MWKIQDLRCICSQEFPMNMLSLKDVGTSVPFLTCRGTGSQNTDLRKIPLRPVSPELISYWCPWKGSVVLPSWQVSLSPQLSVCTVWLHVCPWGQQSWAVFSWLLGPASGWRFFPRVGFLVYSSHVISCCTVVMWFPGMQWSCDFLVCSGHVIFLCAVVV